MSVNTEFQLYRDQGGLFTEQEYDDHLNSVRDNIGNLINRDPQNISSDIGRRIFNTLITNNPLDAVSFSRVSTGLNTRARTSWFTTRGREVVLKYIKKDATYKNYLANGGWCDFLIVGAKAAGVALTVVSSVKSIQHYQQIPSDAPTKTVKVCDDGVWYDVTVIDHPEARLHEAWALGAITAGVVTTGGILGHGIYALSKDTNLTAFFSLPERDILGSETTNCALTLISPEFHEWKIKTMKKKLSSNPPNWQNHERLSTMVCPISNDFMLFPVQDSCRHPHRFDYRSIRAYQLNPNTASPLTCPISGAPNALLETQFDVGTFNEIQGIIGN